MGGRNDPPEVKKYDRDVAVWDRDTLTWKFGQMNTVDLPADVYEIVWTATGANTDVTPDADTEIDILYAKRISIQIDTTHASHTSTDFDVNVETTGDGHWWDTEPYAERNAGDAERKTFLVEPGPAKMRLRGDNNEAATEGYATARVLVVR